MNQSTSGTRDGFQVTRDHLTVPKDSALDLQTKRALAICHLFLNRNMAVADIVWLLDEDTGTVILTLLEQGIIQSAGGNQGRHHRKMNAGSRWLLCALLSCTPGCALRTPRVPSVFNSFNIDTREPPVLPSRHSRALVQRAPGPYELSNRRPSGCLVQPIMTSPDLLPTTRCFSQAASRPKPSEDV